MKLRLRQGFGRTQLWQLVRADLRRLRLTAIVWLVIVAGGATITFMTPFVAEQTPAFAALSIAANLMWLAWALLAVGLVPLVVQAHPAVGSDAFWMTRPFPIRALVLSKFVLLTLLFVVVPLTVSVVVMSLSGVPPDRIVRIALQSVLFRLLVLMLILAVAVLTRNLAGFAMLAGGVLLAGSLFIAALSAIAMSHVRDDAYTYAVGSVSYGSGYDVVDRVRNEPDATPDVVGAVLLIVALAGAAFVQYAGRSRWRSVATGIAGVIAAWLVVSWWPWPLIKQHLEIPDWARQPSSLRFTVTNLQASVDQAMWFGKSPKWRDARAQVFLADVPYDWLPRARLAGALLTLPDGTQLSSPGHGYTASLPVGGEAEAPLHRTLKHLFGVTRLIDSMPYVPQGETAIVFRMTQDDLARHGSATGHYRGQFIVELLHVAVAGVLEPKPGSALHDGGYRTVIDDVEVLPPGMTIRARTWTASSMFDRQPSPVYSIYLRNTRRQEAVSGATHPVSLESALPYLFGITGYSTSSPGFDMRAERTTFPARYVDPDKRIGLTPEWLADAELVVVRITGEGSVSRTLEISQLRLNDRSAGR